LFVDAAAVGQQHAAEVRGRGGAVDGAAESVAHEDGQVAAVVDVRVREHDRVDRPWRDGEARPVAQAQLLEPLEQPAVHEHRPPGRRDEVARSGDGAGRTEEREIHHQHPIRGIRVAGMYAGRRSWGRARAVPGARAPVCLPIPGLLDCPPERKSSRRLSPEVVMSSARNARAMQRPAAQRPARPALPVLALVAALLLVLSVTPAAHAAQQGGRGGAQAAAALPRIEQRTAGMRKLDGFFPLYWDESAGKLWLEVPAGRLDTEVLYITGLGSGLGSNDIGLDRGALQGSRIVVFERVGPKVLMVQPNYRLRASSTNPAEVRAVRDAFVRSVLWGCTVAAQTGERVLVDATDFLFRDAINIGP